MLLPLLIFLILLPLGLYRGEYEWGIALGFAVAATLGMGVLLFLEGPLIWSAAIFSLLDIVLVIWIFKGDQNIS